jgi:hypothetical protein
MCDRLRTIFSFLIVFLVAFNSKSQEYMPLLKKYSDSLRFCKIDSIRYRYNDSFKTLLKSSIDEENAFNLNFDSISNTVSVMLSEDQKMRIISWVYINDKEEYTNHCMVMHRKKIGANANIYWLHDQIEPKTDSLYMDYPSDFWPGALYYQMYHFEKKGKDYYCVLGLNGKNSFNNRKIIDVLWVDKEAELHIGAPVFYSSEKDYTPQYRVIFEYADASTMLLRFEKDKKLITYSNLVPSNPEKMGMRQYYIPDGRIDYYKLRKKGKWVRYEGLTEFDMLGNQ